MSPAWLHKKLNARVRKMLRNRKQELQTGMPVNLTVLMVLKEVNTNISTYIACIN